MPTRRALHGLLIAAVVTISDPAAAQTALEHLKVAPKPVFRKGHTLLPLTRWGWSMPYEVRVKLCEDWGYALAFAADARPGVVAALDDPNSASSKVCALTASDPKKYPLSVILYRPLSDPAFHKTLPGGKLPEETFVHDAKGKRFDNVRAWKTWSPELPNWLYERAAAEAVKTLKKIQAKAPIAILLNGGEYGLNCRGHSGPYWAKDPKVVAAKGDRDWDTYIGQRKAELEMIIATAVRRQVPKRKLYLWYHFGGMPGWTPVRWVWDYKAMRRVADLPGQSLYYRHYNTGWTGKSDLLSNALESHARCVPYGDTLGYHWLCAGWVKGKFSPRELYMGYLKCLYNSGMIGAVAGYFSYPRPAFAADLGPKVPSWLSQMMDLGRAQALFSHLEEFLREGDLLAGPNRHRRAKDLPAYEFPTGHADARVLVRKLRKRDEWLITAWAADARQREVTVEIPKLGKVKVLARPAGSVYRAKAVLKMRFEPPRAELKLLDPDGMHPSASFGKAAVESPTRPAK